MNWTLRQEYSHNKFHLNSLNKLIKIILLGDGGVGKTTFCNKLLYNEFSLDYIKTIGVDYHVYITPNNITPNNITPNNITPNNITPNKYKLQIWDTPGHE